MISQSLCKLKDGSGRVAAHEIMLGTSAIRNLIRENKIAQMYSSIQTGQSMGMQTLDQNLTDLVRRNLISPAEARSKAKIPKTSRMKPPRAPAPLPPRGRRQRPGKAGSAADACRALRARWSSMERDQASKFVNDLLRLMVSRNGSDLFLTADFPPAIKVDGKVTKVSPQPLTGQHTLALARAVMNDKQGAEFERTKECNFAISPQGVGRFRVNAFIQQGHVGLVFRTIPADPAHHRHAGPAAGAEGSGHDQARAGHLRRRHRLGQEHLAGGHRRLAQRKLLRPHHHRRGPGGVRAPAQELHRHPA